MSAFMCSDVHIAILANAMRHAMPVAGERINPRDLARDLYRLNHEAIISKYPDLDEGPELYRMGLESCLELASRYDERGWTTRELRGWMRTEDRNTLADVPVFILKLAECYAYQVCDLEGWEDTAGGLIIARIKARAVTRLAGWEQMPWGVS